MRSEALGAPLADLAENAARIEREREKRYGYLSEAAEALVRRLSEDGEGQSPEALFASAAADPIPLSAEDRVDFAALFLRAAARALGHTLSLSDLPDGPRPLGGRFRTVRLDNPLAEAAYLRFLPLLTQPTCHTRQSLFELCDDVENGYADYAVLPLFADGVAIPSVAALLEERGLAIAAALTLPSHEGELVFGLVSAAPVLLRPPTHFFFRYRPEGEEGLPALLSALSHLSLEILYLDTLPAPYGERAMLRILVRAEEEVLLQLYSYLALYAPTSVGYGFYTELS